MLVRIGNSLLTKDSGIFVLTWVLGKWNTDWEPPRISNMLLIPLLSLFTAEYSVPTITKDCSKPGDGGAGKSCQLSCSAVGGYPQSTVRWTGLNQSLTNVIYNRSSADNESKTWTINQTIMHNCDQPANISCAVGGAVSHTITICECVVGFCSITPSKVVKYQSWIKLWFIVDTSPIISLFRFCSWTE